MDGEKLVFTANREIVPRCGEASITLTRAGKILIQCLRAQSFFRGESDQGGIVDIN
jgi:hypothetical protein